MESHTRTIAKSLTWRITALAITTFVAWLITDKVELAATIGVADAVIKLAAYYSHERAWLKVGYGKLQA